MLSVVVPVKDEPKLEPFLLTLHEIVADIPDQYEVIVVQGDREKKFYPYQNMPYQRTVWVLLGA